MEVQNIYEEINDALQDFKDFLEKKVTANIPGPVTSILKAVNSVLGGGDGEGGSVGEVEKLFILLDDVLKELHNNIDSLTSDALDALPQEEIDLVVEMAEKIIGFSSAAKQVLESQSGTIDDIANITTNVVSVPKLLGQLKTDILDCITVIIGHLKTIVDEIK